MQLILSGFNKFGKHTYNPTEVAVESLRRSQPFKKRLGQSVLKTLVLDTCCERAWAALRQSLPENKSEQVVVIMAGLAERRDAINLERFALNIRDYRIPDNCEHQPRDIRIDASGPEAIRTGVDLEALDTRLQSRGHLSEVSNHAGTFLCNDIYYQCLHAFAAWTAPAAALFVHFPLPEVYIDQLSERGQFVQRAGIPRDAREEGLELFKSALADIAVFCVESMPARARLAARVDATP